MRGIPLVPVCHAGLTPTDLPMPLSLRQGVVLEEAEGVRRLYARIAGLLKCQVPVRSFDDLARDLTRGSSAGARAPAALTRDRAIRKRLIDSLEHHRFRWRTLERLAAEAAVPEDVAADRLRADSNVRFAKGKSGEIIVGLLSRVGDGGGHAGRTTG